MEALTIETLAEVLAAAWAHALPARKLANAMPYCASCNASTCPLPALDQRAARHRAVPHRDIIEALPSDSVD
jgi:hypothetical protein